MIKTVIKLLIVAAVLNALYRMGETAWHYYALRDEAQQLVTFGSGTSTTELQNRILAKAEELDIPLEPANLEVVRDGKKTFVYASYTQPVKLVPTYEYPVDLAFSVEATVVEVVTPKDILK